MNFIGNFVCKHRKFIIIICLILLIPAFIGMKKTKINYDILVYLPDDIETIEGENILTNDFKSGAYAIAITENMADKDIVTFENNIRKIDGVSKVISINDITGTTIPIEFLPSEITSFISKDNSKLILITFEDSTSSDRTLAAVEKLRKISSDSTKIGGMSTMVLDTKELFNSEMTLYVIIAVILCLIILFISLDSFIVPVLLLLNIGVAILFNMGSNIFLGNICYITKAIASVLQLGVTTDFSIFLYHKYEKAKKENKDINKAMSLAIKDTLVSVFGSSLTTIAGFLALCTMNLKLGTDIGVVMAKGVVLGVICVIIVFPALLLTFDKLINMTKHKEILPKFTIIKKFTIKHYKLIFIIFILLLFPAYQAQKKTTVYYKLDSSIPESYGYSIATKTLKDDYNIVSQDLILVSSEMSDGKINAMIDEIKKVDGINLIISSSSLSSIGINDTLLSGETKKIYETDKYKMILINSIYEIATDELNNQIGRITDIVKSYDEDAIVAGEGPLMKDLVKTTDEDFKNVNFTSIFVIFILMLLVLRSISLPVLLVAGIEFAIFINMGIPYFTGTEIPFISSVVIGTIQLGATIDYAILITTKYLEERKKGKDKKESVKSAMDNSITSIFVSGMCFFAATIGVGLVSKIDMIGSLCTLISRGAIISMFVVMTIIPALLIIFDKIIIHTTLGFKGLRKKKGSNNMKKNLKIGVKRIAVIFLISLISLTTISAKAFEKDEIVYSKLDESGQKLYTVVTEHLINNDKVEVLNDNSDLASIENTTGTEEFEQNGRSIIWKANGKDIYYRGKTDKELPIDLKVTYKLNGEEKQISDMLGKSGRVEITLTYTNKLKSIRNVSGYEMEMYTPFLVALTTVLDGDTTSSLSVTNGKVVSNGQSYAIAAVAAPGLYESLGVNELKDMDKIIITYETTNFYLPSIYSAITAELLDMSNINVFDELENLYSRVDTLNSSSTKLVEGSKNVNNGVKQLRTAVINAITELKENNDAIDENTINYIKTQAAAKAKEQIESQKDKIMEEAINALNETEAATGAIKSASNAGIDSNVALVTSLKLLAHEQMKNDENGAQALAACENGMTEYCAYVIAAENQAIETAKESFYQSAINLARQTAANTAYNTALNVAVQTAEQTSISTATTVASQVKSVIINKVVEALNKLVGGLDTLVSGTEQLSNGMESFDSQGIKKINNLVNGDLRASALKVEELTKLATNYNTFTSLSEEEKGTTKFILVIDSQKKQEIKTEVKEEKTKSKNIIDKVVDLFR